MITFEQYGGDMNELVGYKKITSHLVFDIKFSEKNSRKSRNFSNGHKTRPSM